MQDHYENQDAGKRHPDPETIVAYRREFLAEGEMERIQEHLVSCDECLDLLLLEDHDPEEQPGVLDFEKEMIWARLKAARKESGVRATRKRERLGIAAAILAVLVPLGGLGFRQSSVISELTRPQLNVSIHDVLKNGHRGIGEGVRGVGEADSMTFDIPPGTEFYTVVFPVDAPQNGVYEVEIIDSREQPIWKGEGLEVDEFGYATLGLSRRFLDAGTYRIRVFDGRGESLELIGDYPIIIRNL